MTFKTYEEAYERAMQARSSIATHRRNARLLLKQIAQAAGRPFAHLITQLRSEQAEIADRRIEIRLINPAWDVPNKPEDEATEGLPLHEWYLLGTSEIKFWEEVLNLHREAALLLGKPGDERLLQEVQHQIRRIEIFLERQVGKAEEE